MIFNLVASADQLVQRFRTDFDLLLEADGHHGSLEDKWTCVTALVIDLETRHDLKRYKNYFVIHL